MLSADVTFLCEYGDGSGVWVAGARHASEKLHEAVKAKLTEQRKFVLWWDGQEKDKGGDAATHARRRSPTAVNAQDFARHRRRLDLSRMGSAR